ncbi:hypothetical protein RHPLAN_34820 [Rhodoplanes sp. Z2-YC6860]|nr:hypothetical protein RHPLAN_34820 [Rhodoplanes sp. Z2-YC6860]
MRYMQLAIAGMFLIVGTLAAGAHCSTPTTPSCAEKSARLDDRWEFDRCRREMESYKSEIGIYGECVRGEARNQVENAAREYNAAVESFNRRVRGGP